jgi:hypothetical protein
MKNRGLPRDRARTAHVHITPVDAYSLAMIELESAPRPPAWKRLLRPPPPRRGEEDVFFWVFARGRYRVAPVRLRKGRRPWLGPPAHSWQAVADADQQGPDAARVELRVDAPNVVRLEDRTQAAAVRPQESG